MTHLDYDTYYDTKISRTYATSKLGYTAGSFIVFTGCANIALTIADLFLTNYNQDGRQTATDSVYTWDENPIWPTYGKGFWVGLIVKLNYFFIVNTIK